MARSTVLTARGQALNMEELILSAKRPISMQNVDQKDKIESKKQPPRQLNIRGFMPSAAGVKQTVMAKGVVVEPEQPVHEGPSMADLTAVNLKGAKFIKERPADPSQLANETLREIMGDLDQLKKREIPEPPPQRRARKS